MKKTLVCINITLGGSKEKKTDGGQSSESDSSKAEDAGLVILGREEPG